MIYNRRKPAKNPPEGPFKRVKKQHRSPLPKPSCIGVLHNCLWTQAAFLFSDGRALLVSPGDQKPVTEHLEWGPGYHLEGGYLSLEGDLVGLLSKSGSHQLWLARSEESGTPRPVARGRPLYGESPPWEDPHEEFPHLHVEIQSQGLEVWTREDKKPRCYSLPRKYGDISSWEVQDIHPTLASKVVLRNPKLGTWLLLGIFGGRKRTLEVLTSWTRPAHIPYVWTRLGGFLDVAVPPAKGGFRFEFWNGETICASDLTSYL